MAQYTLLRDEDIQAITGRYGQKFTRYEPIEGGVGNTNYLVHTDRGAYILTVFEIDPVQVAQMVQLLMTLKSHNYPAPRLKALDNGGVLTTYKGKSVLFKPFIEGKVIQHLDEGLIFKIGSALGRLHEIPIPEGLPQKHTYEEITYPQVMAFRKASKYRKWVERRYRSLRRNIPSGLPLGLVHGDIFFDNVLFEDENFKAILDFEDACHHYKIFDLGMAVVGLCTENGKTNLEKVKALVDGYQALRPLEEVEKQSLQNFIEYAALLTSTWRFWKYNLDSPDPQKANKHWEMVEIAKNAREIPARKLMAVVFP